MRNRRNLFVSAKVLDKLSYAFNSVNGYSVNYGSLLCIRNRNEYFTSSRVPCRYRHRKYSAYGTHLSRKRKLSDKGFVRQVAPVCNFK